MATAEATALMTTEQLLAMPDDGVERWLIRGQLRERPTLIGQSRGKKMTVRNRWHSRAMIRVGYFLEAWREQQPEPRGSVLGGEAGVRLTRDPDTSVGIDVVYISAELAAQNPADTTIIDGVPVLVVEILSPSNTVEEIDEKLDQYLEAGVPLVWIVDTRDRTVTIYRPGQEPELVNARQELSGEPELPGFRVRVADLFV
jgi:Uma2 family endonuclease